MAIVQYRVKKVSARIPPSKHSIYDVPPKFVLTFEEVALGRCIVLTKYVTRFATIAIVESLSDNSTPKKSNNSNYNQFMCGKEVYTSVEAQINEQRSEVI